MASSSSLTRTLSLSLLLLSLLVVVSARTPCEFSTSEFYTQLDVFNCIATVPFDRAIANHTITQLKKAMELYVFLDIAQDAPYPFDSVHLFDDLDAALNGPWSMDYTFQESVRAAFLKLHDAHTNYYAPKALGAFTFIQPLNLVSSFDASGKPIVTVTNFFIKKVKEYWADIVDLSVLAGAEVVSIQGKPAVEYLTDFAHKQTGLAKDPQTRYNILFYTPPPFQTPSVNPWLGLFSVRPSHFMPIPDIENVLYVLQFPNGTHSAVNFPWIAHSSIDFADRADFLSHYYVTPPSSSDASASSSSSTVYDGAASAPPVLPAPHPFLEGKHFGGASKKRNPYEGSEDIKLIAESPGDGLFFYEVNGALVWYQNNFEPSDYLSYQQALLKAFLYAKFNDLDHLILDMTMNGGGDICLGRAMLSFLFSSKQNFGPTDMPQSPLSRNLTITSYKYSINDTEWSADFYQSQEGKLYSSPEWMIPGKTYTRGGLTRGYSELVHIAEREYDEGYHGGCGQPPFELSTPFSPSNITILTRGFCGSTCALFTNHLSNYDHVKTVVVGGYSKSGPMQYTSFPGLEVLDSGGLYQILDALLQSTEDQTCTSCTAPRRLLTTGAFRMCIREIYKNASFLDAPLEYTYQPADKRIFATLEQTLHPELLWANLAQ